MKNASSKETNKKMAKKKSSGKPRRPLSAYNMFFKIERKKILVEQQRLQQDQDVNVKGRTNKYRMINHAHVGFANLANIISKRWKSIHPTYKEELEDLARLEKIKYKKEVAEWKMKNEEAEHKGKDSKIKLRQTKEGEGMDQKGEDDLTRELDQFAKREEDLTSELEQLARFYSKSEGESLADTSHVVKPAFDGINEAVAFLNESRVKTSNHMKSTIHVGSSSPRFNNSESCISPIIGSTFGKQYGVNVSSFKLLNPPISVSNDSPNFCPPCNYPKSMLSSDVSPDASVPERRRIMPDDANTFDNIMMAKYGCSWVSGIQANYGDCAIADSSFNPITVSPSSNKREINESSFVQICPPFSSDAYSQDFCLPCKPSGSILDHEVQPAFHVPPATGMPYERRSSMPSDIADRGMSSLKNMNMFGCTMMQGNRGPSLFSGVQEMGNIGHPEESYQPPIEEIQRFFGINPQSEDSKITTNLRRNSCMY